MRGRCGCCCWLAARVSGGTGSAGGEPAVRALLAGAGGDESLAVAVSQELSNDDLCP